MEITEIAQAYKRTFKVSYLLQPHPVGMGHQVGHVTLDKTGYLFAKNNLGTKYTMKICDDILISDRFLDLEVEQADVYYLPAVATHEMIQRFDIAKQQLLSNTEYTDSPLTYQSWFLLHQTILMCCMSLTLRLKRVFRTWDYKQDVKQAKVLCAEHSLTKWSVSNKLKKT
jgi:hypothetical protein